MVFRQAKEHLVNILTENAGGRYRVQGYQPQRDSSEGAVDSDQIVRVFYESGEFPRRGGNWTGPSKHEMTFAIHLLVSRAASGDLDTLNDPNATAGDRSTALAAFENAAARTDAAMDELIETVYQIVMDNQFIQLDDSAGVDGSGDLDLASRWVDRIEKGDPVKHGQYVTIDGAIHYKLSCEEEFTGAPEVGTGNIDVDVLVNDDDKEGRAGVLAPE